MNTRNLSYRILILLVLGLGLTACKVTIREMDDAQETEGVIGMANPAAQYCEGMGYTLENVERDGGMDADCVFPDGERCAQWDFLAGRCGQEKSFCQIQGGEIQANGNVGTCFFSDGSTCPEFQLFSGDCAMGDNPAEESEELNDVEEVEEMEDAEGEEILITDFVSALDHLMEYLAKEYGLEIVEPWMETDITDPNSGGVVKFRYLSGMVTVILSAEAAAPYASLYNVQEVSNMTNAFHWSGTIALDGTITEDEVVPPWEILNREDARDAALEFLSVTYEISSPTSWIDEGMSQAGEYKSAQHYSAGSWLVTVEFEPAAPFVSSYTVTVENNSLGLLWEGEITGQGDITEISFTQ